ncbi:FAD-binding oxidoreductase [Acidisoma cellulosilytica]|uniref:FAD-binding oxidoreductase n=1 Tax=Acidisoma cellulosilyticum TaxID=2802395 RepID=A0A964E4S0_9PROT|nr:FAD-binding oxidoreductase [Acidisoma cellulosilyticum]MCB8881223.1 FAD-binding oxidoreductase [Acidisoma cellulosilyticum]
MTADSAQVIAALRDALGDRAVLTGADIPDRNKQDWSTLSAVLPLAVIRPTDPAGVAASMRIAATYGVPVVPQGGLTGLAGGARPIEGSIALSLERLTGIEEIDRDSATMTVRAGTTLEVIQKAAEDAGLYCALDLGARGSCAIGGNVSTNAGGNRVLRYGMAREMVLGLEVVLPDGTLVTSLNKMLKNNAGYDLKQLFIGSEGTLGIITRIVLRLFPRPHCTMAALCGLPSYDAVLSLLASARGSLGPLLSAFEVMWPDYWEVATRQVAGVRDPLTSHHPFYVLVEAQGNKDSDTEGFETWLESQVEAEVITDAAVAQSLADVKAFWGTRDAAAEFKLVLGPHSSFDIGLAVADMDRYADACRARLAQEIPGCFSCFYGHIADGNMHIIACVPGAPAQPYDAIDAVVYDEVRRRHGTVSAEHGIGLKKKPFLPFSRNPEELALMAVIKHALDPRSLLNPGKVL